MLLTARACCCSGLESTNSSRTLVEKTYNSLVEYVASPNLRPNFPSADQTLKLLGFFVVDFEQYFFLPSRKSH